MRVKSEEKIAGIVVRGNGLGRRFGFPTANIEPESEVMAHNGVYVAEAVVDGIAYGAVVNIGHSPSVITAGGRRVEAHLLDFDGDLYGQRLEVRLMRYLRAERRFASHDELVAQIRRDRDEALSDFLNASPTPQRPK